MKREITAELELEALPGNGAGNRGDSGPRVLGVADLLAFDTPAPSMLVENWLPERGASLIVGAAKANKTLIAAQIGIAVASGNPFLENYRILRPGPVLILEQDDPAGAASIKQVLKCSRVPVQGIPFHLVERVPFNFGLELLEWLERQILKLHLRLVVLDSYTALRSSRASGGDIVKSEQNDLTLLDDLAKRTGCAVSIIHHASKGSAALDWSDQAAGTFAMSAATQSQIHVSRFRELEGNAPERLVRIRGRHQEGLEMVVRFRKDTLDHEYVLEGGAAALYPLLRQIQSDLGSHPFGQKELSHATGVSLATAGRQIERLYRAGALHKRGFGSYSLPEVR